MKGSCRIVRTLAPSASIAGLSGRLDAHVSTCLACQAELARYGRLRRQLSALSDVLDAAPAPLVAAVEYVIAGSGTTTGTGDRSSHPARVAAAAGAVVAAAAGAVAVAVWRHSKAAV